MDNKTKTQALMSIIEDPYKGTSLEGFEVSKQVVPLSENLNEYNYQVRNKGELIGEFNFSPSEYNEQKLIVGSPYVNENFQQRGIATEMYKMAEKDSGKKIIPDNVLRDEGLALHESRGLGKKFGMSDYSQDVIDGLKTKAIKLNNPAPDNFARKGYKELVESMRDRGLSKFKAIPFVGPVIGAGLTAAAALSTPDASAAVGDAIVPGGLESLGPSEEDAAIENPQANPQLRRQALQQLIKK